VTSPLRAEDLYHTGFMVPDLPRAMDQLTAAAGHRWTIPIDGDVPIWTRANGPLRLLVRFVYSLLPPHVELIQQIPGTPWMPAPGNAAHHCGYWADDVAATARRLVQLGFDLEAHGLAADGEPAMFAYLTDPNGLRIEIVERSGMPDFPAMLRALTPPGESSSS
jgi:catechol 2,3-dioxygenase-like lactoylglutathione lyase family enzyme